MAKLGINTGTVPNDGTGDTLLDAVVKINRNFNEIYTTFGDGTNITNGVGIQSAGTYVGTGITVLNFIGTGNTFSVSGNKIDISIQGGAGSTTTSGYATIAGYSTSSGVSTTSNYATIAGYSTSSGVSTSVIGGIASVSQLNVSGVTTVGFITATNLYVSGVGTFVSSGLQIRNPANTFGYSIAGGAVAGDKTITIPVIGGTNDTFALIGLSQTFSLTQTFSGTLTGSGTVNLTGTAAGVAHNFGTNQTTSTLTFGGTSGTGLITFGRSTATQQTDIQAGASGVGTTKTINFGTGGLSGSFTQINIGPTAGVGTVVINSGTNLLVGTATSTGTANQTLQVVGGASFTGIGSNVGIGTTNPIDTLSVFGKVSILQDNASNSRLIFRAKQGNAFRWNIDNDSGNLFRIFKEDDATAANGAVAMQLDPYGGAIISGVTTVGLAATSTPPTNSQMSFELTSNTNLRIKVRGTDGVLRSANITLA